MYYTFSAIDLVPYFILIALLFFAYKKKNAKIMAIIIFVFMAIRVGVGFDYYQYKYAVLGDIPDYTWERFEPLSRILMLVGRYTHFQVFFAITSAIIVYFLYKGCEKLSVKPELSLFIYILFPLFFFEHLSVIRNAIAFSIVFYAYSFLVEKKFFYYLLFVALASQFHLSALLGLTMFIPYIFRNYRLHLIGYALSFFIGHFLTDYILSLNIDALALSRFARYAVDGYFDKGGKMIYLINVLGLINLFLWKRVAQEYKNGELLLSIFNYGIVLFNIFSYEVVLAYRLPIYFMLSALLLVPMYLSVINDLTAKKLVVSYFVLSFLISIFININSNLKTHEKLNAFPYQTIFYYKDVYIE